jgi:hypothetical protein
MRGHSIHAASRLYWPNVGLIGAPDSRAQTFRGSA